MHHEDHNEAYTHKSKSFISNNNEISFWGRGIVRGKLVTKYIEREEKKTYTKMWYFKGSIQRTKVAISKILFIYLTFIWRTNIVIVVVKLLGSFWEFRCCFVALNGFDGRSSLKNSDVKWNYRGDRAGRVLSSRKIGRSVHTLEK